MSKFTQFYTVLEREDSEFPFYETFEIAILQAAVRRQRWSVIEEDGITYAVPELSHPNKIYHIATLEGWQKRSERYEL